MKQEPLALSLIKMVMVLSLLVILGLIFSVLLYFIINNESRSFYGMVEFLSIANIKGML